MRITSSGIIKVLALLCVATSALSFIASLKEPPKIKAIMHMGLSVTLIWSVFLGSLQYIFRDKIRSFVLGIGLNKYVKFVFFCIALAMIEEVVTVSLTNSAPLFGVKFGEAYITASGNYFDVVLNHSVIVFVPMFIVLALALKRYAFTAKEAFIMFGLTGISGEAIMGGLSNFLLLGFWSFVYGFMVYLPVYSLDIEHERIRPNILHYAGTVILMVLSAIPFIILLRLITGPHPDIHFQ